MKLCEILSKAEFCQVIAVNIDLVVRIHESCCTVSIIAVPLSSKDMWKNISVCF